MSIKKKKLKKINKQYLKKSKFSFILLYTIGSILNHSKIDNYKVFYSNFYTNYILLSLLNKKLYIFGWDNIQKSFELIT